MRQCKRCFGVKIVKESGGKLQLVGFLSHDEREEYCKNKDNLTRPITMTEWRKVPKSMKI
jgi:hypothetical protein